MKTQRNVKNFFVAKGITGSKATTSDGGELLDVYTDLEDGEIVLVDAGNTILDTGSAGSAKKFRIAQRSGSKLLFSPFIDPYNVEKYNITAYSAPVQQVSYIGYNTSSGSIRVSDSNQYIARLYFEESDRVGFGQQLVKYGIYKSDASATGLEIAEGLYNSFIDNFSREDHKDVYFELVGSDAMAAWTGDTGSTGIAFVNGSDIATLNATGTIATGAYIRTSGEGIYKVKEGVTNGTTITLEQPFEGTSGTDVGGTVIGTNAGVLSATTGSWGIRITGKAREFIFGAHKWNYSVPRFKIGLDSDFGATEITYSTGASEGNGVAAQMAEEEYLAQGNEGDIYRIGVTPPATIRQDVDSSTNYDVLNLQYNETTDTESLGAAAYSPCEIMIAIADGAVQADAATDGFVKVLEAGLTGRMTNYATQVSKI